MTQQSRILLMCSACSLALASQAKAQIADIAPSATIDAGSASDQSEVRTAASADPQTAIVQSETADDEGIADIVVTAQKRSENLQRVPAAVSVVENEKLVALGITSLTQLPNLTTGLSIAPLRTQTLTFIRGVGQTGSSPNVDPAVATNLNGVYIPAEVGGVSFFDVDRIEILPGPQGTLYGRNAAGGVINVTGRLPGQTLSVDGFVEIGNYDRRQVVVGLDLPVSDTFGVRVAGQILRRDGYSNNGLDDDEASTLKGAMAWRPGSGTTLTASVTYSNNGGVGNVLESQPSSYGCGPRCANFDPEALGYFIDSNAILSNWQLEQDLGEDVLLTYVGGYVGLDLKSRSSIFTGPPLAPLTVNLDQDSWSHELRLNGTFGAVDGILGLYYFKQDASYYQRVAPAAPAFSINPFDADSEGWAIFGQGTFSVTDSLRLTGGLRFSRTTKSIDGFNSDYDAAGALLRVLPFRGKGTLERLDYKAGVEFDVSPDVLAYANFATGFNAGGFSSAQTVAGPALSPAAPFDETTLNAWSGGIKTKLFDGQATLNLEGFYYDYTGYQVSARAVTGQLAVFNAEKATIYGLQADVRVRPTRHDDLTVGVTYLDAVADVLRTAGVSYDGFDLPFSPRWTVNASYQRSFDIEGGAQLRGLINFRYSSSRWTLYTHQPSSLADANSTTGINFGYFAPADRWSLQAFVRNLEDSLVPASCGNALPRPPVGAGTGCFYEPPRTYGVTMGFKF